MTSLVEVLELRGDAHKRGITYGRAAARQINTACDYYRPRWGMSFGSLRARVRQFLPTLEQFDSDLLVEVKGIAEGASLPFEEVLALNARNEILFGTEKGSEGCTVIAAGPTATANRHTYLAQNWDWVPELAGSSLLLKIIADDLPGILTFVDAGRLAMHGLNECGLGLCGNYLENRAYPARSGVPIPFLRRRVLQCSTVSAAAALLESTPRSTSSNYLIADRSGAICDCETTSEAVYRLPARDAILVHTNHFYHPDAPKGDNGLARVPDSTARARRAEELLRPGIGQITATVLKTVLTDHEGYPASICRHGDSGPHWQTLASHVVDLDERSVELAHGPPCSTEHRTYRL